MLSKKLFFVQWNRLEDEFDIVSIGYEDKNRQYPVLTGFENWKKQLKKQFPDEENAIDKYFELVKQNNTFSFKKFSRETLVIVTRIWLLFLPIKLVCTRKD